MLTLFADVFENRHGVLRRILSTEYMREPESFYSDDRIVGL